MKSQRSLLLAGVFCFVPLLNFPRALLADRSLYLRDIATVWAPQVEAVVQQIGSGHLPFFDGRRGFGQPLFADPRAEVLYPFAWLHWILPPARSYALFCALHLIIAGLGAARLARRLIPGASFAAQATAGLAYAAGGPMLSLVSHWHHLAAAALMPWIVERASPRPAEETPWLSLSILIALQIFAGSPDYTFATVLLCGVLLVTSVGGSRPDRLRILAALAMGALLSAVQLFPSLTFAHEAAREIYPIGWAISPLHPALTLETIVPIRADGWPLTAAARVGLFRDSPAWMFSHYLGLSVWVLALLGAWHARKADRVFPVVAIVTGVVFAWGVKNETIQTMVAQLPLVSGLRFPTKYLAMSSLGLALLAAFGVTERARWSGRARRSVLLFVAVTSACAAALFWSTTDPNAVLQPGVFTRPALAALCAAAALAVASAERAPGLFPALVALDLLFCNQALNPTTSSAFFRERPAISASIPVSSRLYVSDYSVRIRGKEIRMPASPAYRLAKVPIGFEYGETVSLAAAWYLNPPTAGRFGYLGSFDLDILDFYRRPLKKVVEDFVTSRDPDFVTAQLQRGAVDYVVTMDPKEFWEALPLVTEERRFFESPVRVYKVPGAWPRVRYETEDGSLQEGAPDVVEMRDGAIRLRTATSAPTRVVVAIANDAGWRARVDGVPTPVSDNALAFVSVPLEPGQHLVDFDYVPPHLELGLGVSAVALLTVLMLEFRARSLRARSLGANDLLAAVRSRE